MTRWRSFTFSKAAVFKPAILLKVTVLHWRCSGVFIVNFEHITHLALLLLFLTLNMQMPTGSL